MPTWVGEKRVAVIPAVTIGAGIAPADFKQRVVDRVFFDPDPASGIDRSLRRYIHTVSYGRAELGGDVFGPVKVPWTVWPNGNADPGTTMNAAMAAAGANVDNFAHVMVVFPGAIQGIRSWAFYGPGQDKSYVFLDDPIGAWAMELLHMVTEFGDLYGPPAGRSPSPGNYDEMDTSAATHPSTFTKIRMGWLDAAAAATVDPHTDSNWNIHPLARMQPAPPGRVTAIKVPLNGSATHYLLVEDREFLDEYERNTPDLSAGIPGEGIVVYDVDESLWPPLWLRVNTGLRIGETFSDNTAGIELKVVAKLAGGGFQVNVRSTASPEPVRCHEIRQRIASLKREIKDLQDELRTAPPGAKPRLVAEIKERQQEIANLGQEGRSLNCRL